MENIRSKIAKVISIHALLAESDPATSTLFFSTVIFLSTLSLRRATVRTGGRAAARNFYPRSPCGERPPARLTPGVRREISIHALLAESDSL